MKQEYFYKVVDEKLKSAHLGYSKMSQLSIQYKIGEFVKPKIKGTKLFVFSRLGGISNFAPNCFMQRIFKCEVIKPVKNNFYILGSGAIFNGGFKHDEIVKFWNERKIRKTKNSQCPANKQAPFKYGYGCDAVKLIKEVE